MENIFNNVEWNYLILKEMNTENKSDILKKCSLLKVNLLENRDYTDDVIFEFELISSIENKIIDNIFK